MVFALGVNMLLAQNDSASRMEWAVLSWIMISVLIGWQAHFTKGRMAKGWGFLTFVVLVIFHIMFSRTTAGLQRIPEEPEMIGEKEFDCDGLWRASNVVNSLAAAETSPARPVSWPSLHSNRGKTSSSRVG